MYYKDYSVNGDSYKDFRDYKSAQGINYDKYRDLWGQKDVNRKAKQDINNIEEFLKQYGDIADAKKSNKKENEAILLADILRRIGISEDQLHNLEPAEIKALIRNYDISRILNEDNK